MKKALEAEEREFPLPVTELVTPAKATNWLENNKFNNRTISDRMVDKIARDIKDNKWVYDGNSIKFDKEGNVIDGQHRLWAVIKSQKTVRMLVMRGFSGDAVHTIDIGKPRSNGDVLHFGGFKNTNNLAHSCRISIAYKECSGDLQKWASDKSGNKTLSSHEILKEAETNKGLVEAVNQVVSMRFIKKYISIGNAAFCYNLFSRIDKIAANEFFYLLDKGIDLPEGHPVLLLRNTLTLKEHMVMRYYKGGNYKTSYVIGLIIKAWNAYRDNKFLKRLNFREDIEQYPLPI